MGIKQEYTNYLKGSCLWAYCLLSSHSNPFWTIFVREISRIFQFSLEGGGGGSTDIRGHLINDHSESENFDEAKAKLGKYNIHKKLYTDHYQ